jgi:putative ABC transport system ATP-binding protein
MTPRAVALDLRGVAKAFAGPAGPQRVLAGVDLTVDQGEIVAVAGPSGSGKTTLLTLIAGLELPDEGSIRVLDSAVGLDQRSWGEVAILPQSLGLLGELTVAENIALPLRLADVHQPLDAVELMERLGIYHLADRYPSEVSLGEQQRAALARAAIVRPQVLLADEPISHQNHAWASGMMLLLQVLSDAGTTCLLATHNEIAFEAAHRVFDLHDGRLHLTTTMV